MKKICGNCKFGTDLKGHCKNPEIKDKWVTAFDDASNCPQYKAKAGKKEKRLGCHIQSEGTRGTRGTEKKKRFEIYSSIYELPDGRHAEEIFKDGRPVFLVFEPGTERIEYLHEIELMYDAERNTRTFICPIPIDLKLREALTLPDGIEDYGSIEQLIKEIMDFALAKFDPVSNTELFKLILYLFLSSWFVPRWMETYPERFFPLVSARGPSETGKKRILTIARWITYRPLYFLKTTKVPTLFRAIDTWQGTLVMDEADIYESGESADYIEFLNSRADGVSIPRYSAEGKTTEWWHSFGLTVLATRKPYVDDGVESRTVVFPSESTDNPERYDLIPSKEWMEKGKQLQRKLLLFRLRHLTGEIPTNLIIQNVKGFRVRECLLSLQVLGKEYPKMIDNLKEIGSVLERRLIAERAASREGLVLNIVYNEIDDGAELAQKDLGWYLVKISKSKDDKERQTAVTLRFISQALGETFSSAEIGRIWRGLGQEIKEQMRTTNGTRFKRVLLITNPRRLEREFKKYVPDAVDVLDSIYRDG